VGGEHVSGGGRRPVEGEGGTNAHEINEIICDCSVLTSFDPRGLSPPLGKYLTFSSLLEVSGKIYDIVLEEKGLFWGGSYRK